MDSKSQALTFAEAYAAMRAIGAERRHEKLCLDVQAWVPESGHGEVRWSIWCGETGTHHYGRTGAEALAAYRENIGASGTAVTTEALAAVGDPSSLTSETSS